MLRARVSRAGTEAGSTEDIDSLPRPPNRTEYAGDVLHVGGGGGDLTSLSRTPCLLKTDAATRMLRNVRAHLASHWRIWLLVAVIAAVVNEVVDRNFFDHQERIDGDVVITVACLLVAFFVSYAVVRLKSRKRTSTSEPDLASIQASMPAAGIRHRG